jgi:hypothetical protein
MKKAAAIAVVGVAVLLAGWIAMGPFLAASAIRTAVARNDEAELDQHIDFPAVRNSLKSQIYGAIDDRGPPDDSGGIGNALKSIVSGAMDVMLTPHGVLLLLRHRTALGHAAPDETSAGSASPPSQDAQPQRKPVIHYRFASPNRFVVTVADADYPDVPATLVLHRYGLSWKLAEIDLPSQQPPGE